ncbi:unnamed protein product [Spodoptera exigua]|nr:unnamed protein product [Spodoptera exigua]
MTAQLVRWLGNWLPCNVSRVGKRDDRLPDGKQSAPPMNTRNGGVTSALPTFQGLEIEEGLGEGLGLRTANEQPYYLMVAVPHCACPATPAEHQPYRAPSVVVYWLFEVRADRGLDLEDTQVGKRADGLPDGKQSAPPMDTRNGGVTIEIPHIWDPSRAILRAEWVGSPGVIPRPHRKQA